MSQKLTRGAVVFGALFVVACTAGNDADDSAVRPIPVDDGLTPKSCMYYPGGTVCTSESRLHHDESRVPIARPRPVRPRRRLGAAPSCRIRLADRYAIREAAP